MPASTSRISRPGTTADVCCCCREDPDASALRIKQRIDAHFQADIGVIITDSAGRAWRLGTVGLAIGAAGVPALLDRRGEQDLAGRPLEVTEVGFADASCGRGRAGDGRSRRRLARRAGAWHDMACPGEAGLRAGATEARGSVPMSGAGSASYVALSGGIGGAKLSLGLAHLLGDRLTVIVNTGDDFEHLGLAISPDVDTTLYTLGGVVNPETGWGRRDETWSFMQAMTALGGPAWFNLGDRDLATHVDRTHRLRSGATLTGITAHLAGKFGVAARVLPMTDDPVRTVVETDAGTLAFQEYFVRDQCRPVVRGIRYDGAAAARITPQVMQALSAPDLAGVIICPSNPWLSIDPILAVPGMRDAHTGQRRSRDRGDAHRRRQGAEGADGQDHGRTRHRTGCAEHRLSLW